MADTVQQLLRTRIGDPTPAVKYGDRVWSWREHLTDASAAASALIGIADPERPLHVGALLGNTTLYGLLIAVVVVPLAWILEGPIADLFARGHGGGTWILTGLLVPLEQQLEVAARVNSN